MKEEGVMDVILQESGTDVEKTTKTRYANSESDGRLGQRSCGRTAGSPSSPNPQPPESVSDNEYIRSMEERFGIREEGVF